MFQINRSFVCGERKRPKSEIETDLFASESATMRLIWICAGERCYKFSAVSYCRTNPSICREGRYEQMWLFCLMPAARDKFLTSPLGEFTPRG
jgi:hypothetical protein